MSNSRAFKRHSQVAKVRATTRRAKLEVRQSGCKCKVKVVALQDGSAQVYHVEGCEVGEAAVAAQEAAQLKLTVAVPQ